MKTQNIKFRASQLGKIMHIDRTTQITEKQQEELDALLSKVVLTTKQSERRNYLIEKRDAKPQLSKGAKTYIKEKFYEEKFDFRKSFTNKFVQKGNQLEDKAIKQIVDFLGLPMVFKNEQYFENDYTHGTPDVPLKPLNFQFDVKNVYYPSGLDSFDEKADHDYIWQCHCYNWMIGVDYGFVVKILMNPPDNILEKETKTLWVDAGNEWNDPISDSFKEDVKDYFNFERLPIEDRIKIFKIETNQSHINQIKEAVSLAREYWSELQTIWESKNKTELETIKNLLK